MLELKHITKVYEGSACGIQALYDITLTVPRGAFLAVTGPSGSGKSTFLNILGCLDAPTSGSYRLDGVETTALTMPQLAPIRNKKIGFIFQGFNLIERMTALENVELPLVFCGYPPVQRKKAAQEALARVGLSHRANHRPSELSGGQQQRVAIARALVQNAPLLLADEPTGNLDSRSGRDVLALIEQINREGTTVVLITHDPAVARRAKDSIEICDGKIK